MPSFEIAQGDGLPTQAADPDCDPNEQPTLTVLETKTVVIPTGDAELAIETSQPTTSSPTSRMPVDSPFTSQNSASNASSDKPDVSGNAQSAADASSVSSSTSSSPLSLSTQDSSVRPSSEEPVGVTSLARPSAEPSQPSAAVVNEPGAFYEAPTDEPESEDAGPVYGKRGLAFNSATLTDLFVDKAMSWAYNWAARPEGKLASKLEFVPMLWGEKKFAEWDEAAEASIKDGARHILSFNEPDLPAQANMDAATAAAAHVKYMNPYGSRVKIGSPAITNGGPESGSDGLGLTWMKRFFDECKGECQVDFLAFHWYDSAANIEYFKKHVQEVADFALEHGVDFIWLTEFAASGSEQEVARFLEEALPYLDNNLAVERYAYFMCSEGNLISGGAVSDPVGKAYAG